MVYHLRSVNLGYNQEGVVINMDLTFLRNPEYQSFRKNLDYIWNDEHPMDIEKLKLLMYQRGFKTYKGEREYPTSKQTELAWNYMKDNAEREHYIKESETVTVKKTYRTVRVRGYRYKRKGKIINVNSYDRIYIIKE